MTGSGRHRDAAEAALATVALLAEQAPRFAGWSLAAAQAMLDGPVEVAVVGAPGPDRDALERRARRHPGAVVVVADGPRDEIPLLVGREPVEGRPTAYVCRGFVCERPVTTVEELAVSPVALTRDSTTVTVMTQAPARPAPPSPRPPRPSSR